MITKSDFLIFKKHPAWLWLYKNDKSKLPKVDENVQQMFDDGKELEAYAERLYPEGIRGGLELERGKTFFQHRFVWEDFECTSDIVSVRPDGGLVIIEIKASTSAKDEHILDLAFQRRVAEGAGYRVEITAVLHVNNKYVFGGEIDPSQLFELTDVTDKVSLVAGTIESEMKEATRVASLQEIPDASPRYCGNTDAKKEWFKVLRGLRDFPEASIYELPYLTLPQTGELEDMGIQEIAEIPDDFKLRTDQERLRAALRRGTPEVNAQALAAFTSSLEYPLYFLDYEPLNLSLPVFLGTRPYQQVTFQYSLHIQDTPGGAMRHEEYVHDSDEHPLPAVARKLREVLGDAGSVIVWSQSFEKGRNNELGEAVPELVGFFAGVNERIVDLMVPFKQGYYDHPKFLGSASIKKVLPVLVPDLSYKELEVQEGKSASRLWREAVVERKMTEAECTSTLGNLRTYCELDTLAMVRILEAITALAAT